MTDEPSDAPHAIIVGAGFAGLSAVDGLRKAGVQVTVIDKNLYSTFQPLLYQVATGGLNPGDVAYPVGGFTRQRAAPATSAASSPPSTPAAARIKLADGRELGYDYLIIATGVSANYFGVKGAAENTFGLYTRADAIVLRDHIMNGFERLSADPDGRGSSRSPWSAAAPPGSSWPAPSASCATTCCAPRSPTSTPTGCTSGWSRWRPSC